MRPFAARASSLPGAHFNGVFAKLLQVPEHSSPIVIDNDFSIQPAQHRVTFYPATYLRVLEVKRPGAHCP
jgi:hypothetical protein